MSNRPYSRTSGTQEVRKQTDSVSFNEVGNDDDFDFDDDDRLGYGVGGSSSGGDGRSRGGIRERSSSDMTRVLKVPLINESVKFPSAPLVASEIMGEEGGSSSSRNKMETSTDAILDYRSREKQIRENDARLGVYCSPRFYRKKNYALSAGGNDSYEEAVQKFDNAMDDSPTDSNGSSARSELSKRSYQENIRKKRPLSLVGIDSRRRYREGGKPQQADGISNLGSSCCNLRTSLNDRDHRQRSPTSKGARGQSNLSPFAEKTPAFQLSRSCSDLRDGGSPLHPTIQELRCPSHVSLQSIRVSSPSESRISLLSDLEIYERAHHYPRHADSPPLYPEVGCPQLSSTALVQQWLARQEMFGYHRQNSGSLKQRTKPQPR